jgi:hypothetical protein
MGDIFKFQKDDECCEEICPTCAIVDGYLEFILQAEDEEEVRAHLIGLFDDAFNIGWDSSIETDIKMKQEMLEGKFEF